MVCVIIELLESDHQEKIRVYKYVDKSSASVGQQIFITWSRLRTGQLCAFQAMLTC
jgi:hypothetical protein